MPENRFRIYHRHFSDQLHSNGLVSDGSLILAMAGFDEFQDFTSGISLSKLDLMKLGIHKDSTLSQMVERLEMELSRKEIRLGNLWREKYKEALLKKTPCADADRLEEDAVQAYRNVLSRVLEFCKEGVIIQKPEFPPKVESPVQRLVNLFVRKG